MLFIAAAVFVLTVCLIVAFAGSKRAEAMYSGASFVSAGIDGHAA